MVQDDLGILLPELLLALFALGGFTWAFYNGRDKRTRRLTWSAALLMGFVALGVAMASADREIAFAGLFFDDAYARFAKVVMLIAAALILLMGRDYMARRAMERFEYPILVVLAVIGMMVMVSAGDLLVLYAGLELQAVALYVLVNFRRDSRKSTEAGLKFVLLGTISSVVMLFGISLVYGAVGSSQFIAIQAASAEGTASIGFLIGVALILAALGFRVAAVPFHMWAPDVHEGAPVPVGGFVSSAAAMGAMVLMGRVLQDGFGGMVDLWQGILALMAALTMLIGAVGMLRQSNIKRFVAYSSMTQMGFALMGLSAGTVLGVQAMLIVMLLNVIAVLGICALILTMEQDGHPIMHIAALANLAQRESNKALALMGVMLSLAGVPPMAGIIGKLYVFRAMGEAGLFLLALLAGAAMLIAGYAYLRIVWRLYFADEGEGEMMNGGRSAVIWMTLMGAGLVLLIGTTGVFGIDAIVLKAAEALLQ